MINRITLLLFLGLAWGQNIEINGYVQFSNDSIPNNILVRFEMDVPDSYIDTAITDSTGYYDIELPEGIYKIEYSYDGIRYFISDDQILYNDSTLNDVILVYGGEKLFYWNNHPTYNSLQACIDSAETGDVIILSSGTYYTQSNATFYEDKDLTITSYYYLDGDTSFINQTIIVPISHSFPIVLFNPGLTRIIGMTFTIPDSLNLPGGSSLGGFIAISDGNVEISHSIFDRHNRFIVENSLNHSNIIIYNCIIRNISGNVPGNPDFHDVSININSSIFEECNAPVLETKQSNVTINNSSFINNIGNASSPLYDSAILQFKSSGSGDAKNINIVNSNFISCSGYSIIYSWLKPNDTQLIDNCYFNNNRTNYGVISSVEHNMDHSLVVRNCTITNNEGYHTAGASFRITDHGEILFEGNSVADNTNISNTSNNAVTAGLYFNLVTNSLGTNSGVEILNCTIAKNKFENISIFNPYSKANDLWLRINSDMMGDSILINNSIIYNDIIGGSEILVDGANIKFNYSNIYNPQGVAIHYNTSNPQEEWFLEPITTNVNGDPCDVWYNIGIEPMFVFAIFGNYELREDSPCIDAGDPESLYDPDGSITDMGAFPSPYGTPLSIDKDVILQVFALHQNYPNPFNPITTLRYDLPEDALVNITIYDMMGRIVKNMVNSQQNAGFKSVRWNATNDKGSPVSAGLYLYTIEAGEFRQTKKMVLLK